jgi:hypothetical protein
MLLQVDTGGAFTARLGQVLRVRIAGQWTNMRVFQPTKRSCSVLRRSDTELINFHESAPGGAVG